MELKCVMMRKVKGQYEKMSWIYIVQHGNQLIKMHFWLIVIND